MKIIITYRSHDVHAHLAGNTGIWGCGSTVPNAIGDLVLSHPEAFGVVVQHDEVNPVPMQVDGLEWERQKGA